VYSLVPGSAATQTAPPNQPLANYDVRQEMLAAPAERTSNLGTAISDAGATARQRAIEAFRNRFPAGARNRLRMVMNEAGLPKMVVSADGPLAAAQSGRPDSIARKFLSEHAVMFGLSQRHVTEMKLKHEDRDQGTTFLNYEQMIDGVSVFQGQVQMALSAAGEVISAGEGLVVPNATMNTTPRMGENEAMQKAVLFAGKQAPASFDVMITRPAKGDRSLYRNPFGANREALISDLKIMRVGGRAVLAWHSYLEVGPSEWYEILVDASTGALLYRYNLYADVAQGTVYKVNGLGTRTLESFVGDTTINTAAGWLGASTVTTGNNVDAYLDANADNLPDAVNTADLQNGRAFSATQNFTFPFALGVDPRTQRAGAVANLFYFNNIIHDFAYNLGFTEAAGNFQTNNFGRGGLGNDSVRAEAQDGSGTNNANFATPPDGQRPRMQMFLFTRGTTSLADDRDGDVDGDVVLHEYGHGISNRLVGGPSNTSCLSGTQAGAMGEGWSDYWAATFYNNGVIGEFVTGNLTNGIRRAAYTVPANPIHDSYADIGTGGFQVHRDGEVWAATLWDLRQTLGAVIADRLVLQGMKFTPCSPSFLDARDGILTADQNLNGGANRCAIWRVFARHGMGVSAVGNNGTTHVAATDVPADCNGGGGGTVTLLNEGAENGATGWTVNTASGSAWFIQTTTASRSGARRFRSNSTTNYANNTDTRLVSPSFSLTGRTSASLVYFVKYSTQTNADFYSVEASTDNGATWQTLTRVSGQSPGFSAWAQQTVNLSSLVGNGNVRLRFRLTSNAATTAFGVALDDIVVTAQ
jgi:hypothetical protein